MSKAKSQALGKKGKTIELKGLKMFAESQGKYHHSYTPTIDQFNHYGACTTCGHHHK